MGRVEGSCERRDKEFTGGTSRKTEHKLDVLKRLMSREWDLLEGLSVTRSIGFYISLEFLPLFYFIITHFPVI